MPYTIFDLMLNRIENPLNDIEIGMMAHFVSKYSISENYFCLDNHLRHVFNMNVIILKQ